MKKQSLKTTYIYLLGTIIVSLLLNVGCGKDSGGGAARSPNNPQNPGIVDPQHPNGYYNVNYSWGGKLTIVDHKVYESFLSDHGICDFPGMIWGFGTWDCSNYNALYVSLHLENLKAPTQGIAQLWNYYNNTWAVLPPSVLTGEFAPIDNNTGIEIYRRGYDGTYTYNGIFRYRVYGQLKKGSQLTMELWYNKVEYTNGDTTAKNTKFATATLVYDGQ